MSIRSFFAVLAFSIALPSLASAQRGDVAADTARATLFTGGGFGGQDTVTFPPILGTRSGSANLDATPLVGLRYESPLHRYFLLGAQFRSSFWRDQNMSDRNPLLDFDVTAKARYGFRVKQVVLEPYALLPFGFTLAVWNSANYTSAMSAIGLDKTNPGWNIGGFAGLTILTRSGFGGMIELGAMHHAGYDKDNNDNRYSLTLTQFTLHVGVTYAF